MPRTNHPSRRSFLAASLTGASAGLLADGQAAAQGAPEPVEKTAAAAKVRYDELLPHEFRSRLAERPIAYLPLGTWNGTGNTPVGLRRLQPKDSWSNAGSSAGLSCRRSTSDRTGQGPTTTGRCSWEWTTPTPPPRRGSRRKLLLGSPDRTC